MKALRENKWGAAMHEYAAFAATVDPTLTSKTIIDPKYWVNVARQIPVHSEIRCLSESGSFVAHLFVSHVDGNDIKTHVMNWTDLDKVEKIPEYQGYLLRKDTKGWYAVAPDGSEMWNGKRVATQKKIKEEIDEHREALAA